MKTGKYNLNIVMCIVLCLSSYSNGIDFTDWHTPTQMETELTNLASSNPSIAKIFTIGNSVESRPIKAIKISDNVSADDPSEGDVVFVGLHHAREWISAEMCLYLAEYLINTYNNNSDPELKACINALEIWIIPAINPDGYHYTTIPGNRFWRKNRRDNSDGTYGVDLNRNYSWAWGGGSGSEGSDFTFHDCYRGPYAFSEPETEALRDFVKGLDNPKAMLSYHSFSQLFLRPWANTNADPPGERSLKYIAQDSIARIASVHGQTYGESIWYNCYGETGDYFWGEMRLATFTPELRPASGGLEGFNPPTSQIIPNNEENLPAAIALVKDAGCRKVWIKDHAADTGYEPSAVWLGTGWSHAFWESPDIWTVPAELIEGSTVNLHVRVHNDSSNMPGCTVAAFYTDPRIILEFPALTSVLIGEQTLNLPPGDSTIVFPWTVPTGTNVLGERHWCVGAIVYHPDDRPLTTQVQRTSNIGCRNFQTIEATIMDYGYILKVAVSNFLDVEAEYRVFVEQESLPKGWSVDVLKPRYEKVPGPKARLLGIRANLLDPGEVKEQKLQLKVDKNVKPGAVQNIRIHAGLFPLVPGKRMPVGSGYTFQVRVRERPDICDDIKKLQ